MYYSDGKSTNLEGIYPENKKKIFLINGHETKLWKTIMIGLELHGMHSVKSEFITHGSFRAESKILKVQHFNKTGSTNSMESASDKCS